MSLEMANPCRVSYLSLFFAILAFSRGYFDRASKQLASTCPETSLSVMSLYQTKDSTVRHSFGFFDTYSDRSFAAAPRNTGLTR
jgi:hypothetical protein